MASEPRSAWSARAAYRVRSRRVTERGADRLRVVVGGLVDLRHERPIEAQIHAGALERHIVIELPPLRLPQPPIGTTLAGLAKPWRTFSFIAARWADNM